MIKTLINWIFGLFRSQYQSNLETFINRRNPTSVSEVEHWEREYSRYQSRGLL